MSHPAIVPGAVAVVTGGASGIGLAATRAFLKAGLKVCVADRDGERLDDVAAALRAEFSDEDVMGAQVDVSDLEDLHKLEAMVAARFGGTDILMNNAGMSSGAGMFGPPEKWARVFAVNLWGVIHGAHVFAPGMIARERPGLIINTGSKQGITTPPGDPAYNVTKAGVKAFTEALAHELRTTPECQVSAHLLIPGFVYTPLTAQGRGEKPDAAWTPEQTIAFMLTRLEAGDFYILCPDNAVPRALDEKRILWAAGDVVQNRPALSRWHPDFAEAFATYVKGEA